jgi:hypothetical protein
LFVYIFFLPLFIYKTILASKESLFVCQKGALIHLERQHDSSRQPYTSQAYRNFEKHTVRDMQFIESLDLILCFVNGQVVAHRCKEPFDSVAVINQYTPINAFAAKVFKVCRFFGG